MLGPDYFFAKVIVYSALLGVMLLITGLILAGLAQWARNRERMKGNQGALDRGTKLAEKEQENE